MTLQLDHVGAWWRLSVRHLEMAERLLPEYADGSFSHVYHAAESAASACLLTLAPEEPLPGATHRDKFYDLLERLGPDSGLGKELSVLWPLLDQRNKALYVGWSAGKVREPEAEFQNEEVRSLLEDIRAYVTRLRSELRP